MTRNKIHQSIYTLALLLMAIAIPVSKAAPHVIGGVLFANWILQWNVKEKWNLLKKNKMAIFFALFFFFFAYTFISTDHPADSFRAWISKLPFFYLPIVIATTPRPSLREQRFTLLAFSITVTVATLISLVIMQVNDLQNIRDGGLFISHIRFSICAVLSILIDFFLFRKTDGYKLPIRIACVFMGIWTIIYLFIIQVFTGIVLLMISSTIIFFYYCFSKKKLPLRKAILTGLFCMLAVILAGIFRVTCQYFYYDAEIENHLPEKTQKGNPYTHNVHSMIENGHKIGLFVCEKELRESWAARSSSMPYDSVATTLVRYLNSKNLTKDAKGVNVLTNKEIHNVEEGIANVDYTQKIGLRKMLYPAFFSATLYKTSGMAYNSSVFQRIELWKNSRHAIRESPLLGYGIGQHKAALDRQLDKIDSPLKRRMGSHNQFLAYLLMGGIPLLTAFLILFFAPFFDKKCFKSLFYILFMTSMFISFLFEDTLETGTGLYIFLFFSSFLLFATDKEAL